MSIQQKVVNWEDYFWCIQKRLPKELEQLDKDRTCIISIGRGGMIPSCILSHELDIEYVLYLGIKNHEYSKNSNSNNLEIFQNIDLELFKNHNNICNIILVDDLIDSGKTLEKVIEIIKQKLVDYKIYFCCLCNKITKNSITAENLQIEKVITCQILTSDVWVVFPYES